MDAIEVGGNIVTSSESLRLKMNHALFHYINGLRPSFECWSYSREVLFYQPSTLSPKFSITTFDCARS